MRRSGARHRARPGAGQGRERLDRVAPSGQDRDHELSQHLVILDERDLSTCARFHSLGERGPEVTPRPPPPRSSATFRLRLLRVNGFLRRAATSDSSIPCRVKDILRVAGHQEDLERGVLEPQAPFELDARDPRHDDIRDDEIERRVRDQLESFGCAAGLRHGVAQFLEHCCRHPSDREVVVDDEERTRAVRDGVVGVHCGRGHSGDAGKDDREPATLARVRPRRCVLRAAGRPY